ncbi:histidine kinase [Nonomuraea angiospora]|uniref:histidine kinase n=1 Tax=Nonomuraea angiospora TaxID=46172 RepID=UPI003325AFA7
MSVISVQAGLGRFVALSDPATAHAALGAIANTSHEALTEMRRQGDDQRPGAAAAARAGTGAVWVS